MRNEKNNQKGDTNVKVREHLFDITKSGVSDSNANWYDLQTYYDEDEYQSAEKVKDTEKAYEAVERGRALRLGRTAILSFEATANRRIRDRRRQLQAA